MTVARELHRVIGFSPGGWFAATYIAVRVVGLARYGRVAWDDVAKRAAVRRFAPAVCGWPGRRGRRR
jgi:hypothetical protein